MIRTLVINPLNVHFMSIDNIPDLYLTQPLDSIDLFIYDFKMTEDVIKSKVNLNMHMFSFLQVGKKQVHIEDATIKVNKDQSILLKKGNCLWTELLDTEAIYYCRLLFFNDKQLKSFLNKHTKGPRNEDAISYFVIENDAFIDSYLDSLTTIFSASMELMQTLLEVKFEELMLYLLNKYGEKFEDYLYSLISKKKSAFHKIVDNSTYSSVTIEELAFLSNMSLSTFKRRFIEEFKSPPGKWLRNKRLSKAKELLQSGTHKSSEIYQDLGYNNLSNFSSAFKNKFGISPNQL